MYPHQRGARLVWRLPLPWTGVRCSASASSPLPSFASAPGVPLTLFAHRDPLSGKIVRPSPTRATYRAIGVHASFSAARRLSSLASTARAASDLRLSTSFASRHRALSRLVTRDGEAYGIKTTALQPRIGLAISCSLSRPQAWPETQSFSSSLQLPCPLDTFFLTLPDSAFPSAAFLRVSHLDVSLPASASSSSFPLRSFSSHRLVDHCYPCLSFSPSRSLSRLH